MKSKEYMMGYLYGLEHRIPLHADCMITPEWHQGFLDAQNDWEYADYQTINDKFTEYYRAVHSVISSK